MKWSVTETVATRLPEIPYEKLAKALDEGLYLTPTEFLLTFVAKIMDVEK